MTGAVAAVAIALQLVNVNSQGVKRDGREDHRFPLWRKTEAEREAYEGRRTARDRIPRLASRRTPRG
jgi:hypothetical protein